jgi:septal ring factor EnvC (AmiA/AmiB activator)
MKLKKLRSFASTGLIVVVSGVILSSCTCKVKDDQLSKLAELRRQERTLSSELTAQQNAKAKLDNELNARTAEVKDCHGKLEIVKQRLSVWPNIWSDYTPQP